MRDDEMFAAAQVLHHFPDVSLTTARSRGHSGNRSICQMHCHKTYILQQSSLVILCSASVRRPFFGSDKSSVQPGNILPLVRDRVAVSPEQLQIREVGWQRLIQRTHRWQGDLARTQHVSRNDQLLLDTHSLMRIDL